MWESAEQKLLGVKLGRNLSFDNHVISKREKTNSVRKII